MAKFIEKTVATCDYVGAKKKSDKIINISFDEWNVWDSVNHPLWIKPCCEKGEKRIEQDYTFEDALLTSSMLMTLINHSDRVKISCISELVNSIAPIKTEGERAYAQTIFYPFCLMSKYARGTALRSVVECDKYSTAEIEDIPYIDTASVWDKENGRLTVAVLNRSLTESIDVKINFSDFVICGEAKHIEFSHEDLKAINTAQNPDNVICKDKGSIAVEDNALSVNVAKHSFNIFTLELKGE